MNKYIKYILSLMLAAASAVSCNVVFLSDDIAMNEDNLTVVVNGIVSDVTSNSTLTGIKITFEAFKGETEAGSPLESKTVYTDSNGIYSLQAEGFTDAITCILTAESTDQNETQYVTLTNKIVVTWTGSSYDEEEGTFYVNNCNFQMLKR